MNKLQDETNRNMFQSHVAVAISHSNVGNLHAHAGLEESWSDFCKFFVDSAAEVFGTEIRTHRV